MRIVPVAAIAAIAGAIIGIAGTELAAGTRETATPRPKPYLERVIDGDTFVVRSANGPVHIRPAGYDAAGVGRWAQCSQEKVLGVVAQIALEEILAPTARVEITPQRRDRWNRLIADVTVNGRDLTELMLARAPAAVRPWRGKREDWCR